MFFGSAFTGKSGDISNWDVSSITNMRSMFTQSVYDGDLSKWDVSHVTDMHEMFYNCKFSGLNGDISNWDVSHVTNMSSMFSDNKKFKGNISKWNVSRVTEMSYMFHNSKFNGNLDNWNVNRVTNMKNIFIGSPLEKNPPVWYFGEISKEARNRIKNIPASDKSKLISLNNKLNNNKGGALTTDEMSLLKKYYKEVDKTTGDLSVKYPCILKGNDYKYGTFFIDPVNMLWRGKTFDEFYSGGFVD